MYKIRKEVLEAILNYLANQKFNEVHMLIAEIQKVEEIKEDEL